LSLDNAIQNVGEYYAAHYLAEQFAKDIADQVKAWKAQGFQSVPRRLQALSDLYLRAKTQALEYPDPEIRARAEDTDLRSWHSQLLAALGYASEPLLLELESEKQVLPASLRLSRHSRPWIAVLEAPFCLSDGDQVEEPLEINVGCGEPANRTEGLAEPGNGAVRASPHPTLPDASWEKASALLFKQEDRSRWALLRAGSRVYLFDAHTYAQGRYLYVNLDDAFARNRRAGGPAARRVPRGDRRAAPARGHGLRLPHPILPLRGGPRPRAGHPAHQRRRLPARLQPGGLT